MRTWSILPAPTVERDLREGAKTMNPDGSYDWHDHEPGTVFCTEEGDLLLVGDVNVIGGVCDDCREHRLIVAILGPDPEWKT